MKNSNYIREFRVDTIGLNKNELEVLVKLVGAAKLMANVYKLQLNSKGQPNFYPLDATKKEIEKSALSNDQILSPYTVIERDSDGKLAAVPYHIKYQDSLKLVTEKIEEAVKITNNKDFANALRIQAKALLTGEYEKAQIAWRKMKPYILHFVVGPNERLEDELFFTKRSYEAWVGIMKIALTDRANHFKDIVFTARRRFFAVDEKIDFMDKAQIRVDNMVIFAGLAAKYKFSAATLPNDIEILERYGSEATIFLPPVDELFSERHMPIFNTIFANHFRKSFSLEDLKRGYLYTVIMHEIARVFVRYRFATNRLKELYPIFNELTVEASAIKTCGSLLLKDVISQKEMESVLVMFLTRIFDYYFEMKDKPATRYYVLGNSILLRSLMSSGAINLTKEGISWPNFTKVFIAVSNLADEMERILAEGTYKDAQHYLDEHSSLATFRQFKLPFDKMKGK